MEDVCRSILRETYCLSKQLVHAAENQNIISKNLALEEPNQEIEQEEDREDPIDHLIN